MSNEQITSIADLGDAVLRFEREYWRHGLGFPPIWYRGQSVGDWELEPKVLRANFIDAATPGKGSTAMNEQWPGEVREQGILRDFHRMASSLVPAETTKAALYMLAQHHGLPTRLLDWTTNALVGLFNAVSSPGRDDVDGAIFVINAHDLVPAEHACRREHPTLGPVITAEDQPLEATVRYLFGGGERPDKGLIWPLLPTLHQGRMFQQAACFTLHMPGAPPLREQSPRIDKLVVPAESKRELYVALRRLGINWATLFPDLDHIAREIRVAYQLEE